jgi:GNAT superfamily N-acetyltransferase
LAPDLRIVLTDAPAEADKLAVREGLLAHSEPFIGPANHRPLAVLAYAADGSLRGGLVGETVRLLLGVDLLWVAPEERGRGLGSRLLRAAEGEAVARGCRVAFLGTADYQARPFYERHGYRVFGTLEGAMPNGHRIFHLAKTLVPAAAAATPG